MDISTTVSTQNLTVTASPIKLTLTDIPLSVTFRNVSPARLLQISTDAGSTWEYLRPGDGRTLAGSAALAALFRTADSGSATVSCEITQESDFAPAGAYAGVFSTPAEVAWLRSPRVDRSSSNGILFIGDSFTAGTGAGPTTMFANVLPGLIGAPWVDVANVVNAGISGQNSKQMADRIQVEISAAKRIGTVVIEAGANDASQLVSGVEYARNIQYMIDSSLQAGKRVLVYAPPPRTSPATTSPTIYSLLAEYRSRSAAICKRYGVAFADINIDLQDKTTGQLKSAYSYDGLHVSPSGHWLMASRGAAAYKTAYPRPYSSLGTEGRPNLISNGLFLSDLSGWTQGTGTSTNPTFGVVADPYGNLEWGQCAYLSMTAGNGALSLSRAVVPPAADSWVPGDTLVIGGQLYLDDVVNTTYANQVISSATVARIYLQNQSGALIATVPLLAGARAGALSAEVVVPDGTTALTYGVSVYYAPGGAVKMYAGQLSLINKTQFPGLSLV